MEVGNLLKGSIYYRMRFITMLFLRYDVQCRIIHKIGNLIQYKAYSRGNRSRTPCVHIIHIASYIDFKSCLICKEGWMGNKGRTEKGTKVVTAAQEKKRMKLRKSIDIWIYTFRF